jgi:hypothetical protein
MLTLLVADPISWCGCIKCEQNVPASIYFATMPSCFGNNSAPVPFAVPFVFNVSFLFTAAVEIPRT